MEPDAIWIYHPVEGTKHMRITPQDAQRQGWYLTPDFRLIDLEPIAEPAPIAENASEGKIESRFCCDICGKTFNHRLAFAGHKRSHK